VLALSPRAHAQRTGEEWVALHAREAMAQIGDPRGAVALLRLWAQRDWVDPNLLLDRLQSIATAPRAPALRRALARYLEGQLRSRLGQSREAAQISEELGFITRWLVIGPFDNEGRGGFDRAMPPESERGARPDPSRAYEGRERPVRWRPFPEIARGGYVALDAVVRPALNVCAFAHTTVTAPRDTDAVLWLGAAGQIRAYVNAAEVYRDDAVRGAFPDRAGVRLRLRRGGNRVLLKVCTDNHALGFFARFTRPDGAPLAGLGFDLDPASAPEQSLPREGTAGRAPAVLGVLAELRALAEAPRAPAQALEDYARYLALTRADNTAAPEAADLAERAATQEPSLARLLLVADLASDRNRRLAALRSAEGLAPNDAHVLAALGHERRQGAHPDDALPVLDRAVALDDGYVLARVERALTYDAIGLPLAAWREIQEVAARAPRAPAVLSLRATIAEHAQLFDEAYALRRAYLRVRDDDVAAHEAVAREARARGDRGTLRRATERMLAVEPDRLNLYLTAAELLEAASDGEGALGVLARAVEIAPDEPALWRARGELEVRLGRVEEGRGSMRRALALSPQDRTLRQHVEALEPPVPRADEALAESSEVFLRRRVAGPGAGGGYKLRSLQDLTVRTVYPNGLAGTFRQSVFQVVTQEGAEAARSFPMQYEPDTQRFELRAARVYHPNGTVDESAGIEEYALTGGASRMYYDSRAMVLSFPRLAPGDVVEVRWRVDDVAQRNAFADYFGDLHLLQAETPRAQVRYVLRAPASRQLYFRVPTLPRLVRSEREDDGTRIYDFLATDVAAVPPEDHAPGLTERAAYIHVSTYRTWQDVGRWYWGLIADQLQADDRVRRIVRDITRGLTRPRDRVRAIYDWVIHNTRYVALEFGIHGFLPYRVPEVCSRGFGDCKDKASTIVSMLREVGIDASVVLVRTRNNGAVDPSPASLAVFDHAIVYVPPMEGYPEGLFLDGTAQSSGMDELPSADQGAMALVVNQRGEARLTQIPHVPADRNVAQTRSEVVLQPGGGANMHVVHDVRGPGAGPFRMALEAQATRAERLEQWLAPNYPGVRVTDVRANDMNDVDHPAHVEYDAVVPTIGTLQGSTLLLPLLAPLNLTREYASRSARTSDVLVSGPLTVDERRTIRLPAGATVVDLPSGTRIDTPFVRLELTVERQGGTIVVHRVLTYPVDRVPLAQYNAFREACQRIDDALGRRATIQLAGSP
jgi:hypothetical protein